MRRPTLGEKRFGPGYRPGPSLTKVAKFTGCGVEGCADPVAGSMELYVDDVPPMVDWYSKLLRSLERNTYVRVGFCQGHLTDVIQRSVYETMDDPDQWAPWRSNPPVLARAPKLKAKPKLVVP